jgi:hypothetical protein
MTDRKEIEKKISYDRSHVNGKGKNTSSLITTDKNL